MIKKIEAEGAVLIRHGGRHDWYQNIATKVPRHNEINEHLARTFCESLPSKFPRYS